MVSLTFLHMTLFPTLNRGASSHRVLINHFFPLAHQRKSVKGYFVVLLCLEFKNNLKLDTAALVSIWFTCFLSQFAFAQPFCRVQRRPKPNLTFDLRYFGDLIPWLLLRGDLTLLIFLRGDFISSIFLRGDLAL